MIVVMFAPIYSRAVLAEDESEETNTNEAEYMGLFIVKKTWENDQNPDESLIRDENNNRIRPTSINIRIEGSDNSVRNDTLLESKNWSKTFRLPTKNGQNDITYTVYETDTLEKYKTNATADSKLTISLVNTGRNLDVFNVKNTGFSNIPQPTVSINPNLDLANATRTFSEGSLFTYATNRKVYTTPNNSSETNDVRNVIFYDGPLAAPTSGSDFCDNEIAGTITLEWQDTETFHPATDIYGNTYPIKITLSNIVIRSLTATDKEIAIIANGTGSRLIMQSYVGEFTDGTSYDAYAANLVGVKADVSVEIVGISETDYTMAIFDDIDIPDWVDYYKDKKTFENNNYFGVDYPYAESIKLVGAISSDVYISDGTTYLVYDSSRKFASRSNNNDSTYTNRYTMMIYLAPAKQYSFEWAGSDCGTSLFNDVYLPDLNSITNTITNISGLYKVRYFFQDDTGKYDTKPDKEDKLAMIKPDSKISVRQNAKKDPTAVDPTRTNYELDTVYTKVDEEKMVTSTNDAAHPQILDVYFKKNCIVVYHDNINEDISIGTLWDPKDQTTDKGLYIESDTPAFKGDVTTANPGYKFTGWSIVDPADRSETKLPGDDVLPKVDRVETHYLAHWEALPNQYIVEYYYEKNGLYPPTPDDRSPIRTEYNGERVYTDSFVKVEDSDLIPDPKMGKYVLNDAMKGDWQGTVKANGLVLKVYFKQKPERLPYEPPVTGID